jgi:hypothetical protein
MATKPAQKWRIQRESINCGVEFPKFSRQLALPPENPPSARPTEAEKPHFFTASQPYRTAGAIGAGGWRDAKWVGLPIFSRLRSLTALRAR